MNKKLNKKLTNKKILVLILDKLYQPKAEQRPELCCPPDWLTRDAPLLIISISTLALKTEETKDIASVLDEVAEAATEALEARAVDFSGEVDTRSSTNFDTELLKTSLNVWVI